MKSVEIKRHSKSWVILPLTSEQHGRAHSSFKITNSAMPSAKKSPAKKMSAMKPAKMAKKQVDVSAKKNENAAKKQVETLKKSSSSSEGAKTRAASNRASLDSLMAEVDFNKSEGGAKRQVMGMPVKDFSESAVAVLLQNKVENEKILKTAARAM